MFLRQIDLTTAQRPSLLPEETLLFVQDAVGLYSGKAKLPDYQNGQVYLTSHRACYVDNVEPRKRAVAVDLKDVDHHELYAGFLKSSPKVTLYSKAIRLGLGGSRQLTPSSGSSTPSRRVSSARRPLEPPPPKHTSATWICPICSFSNPVPSNFDPALANDSTPLGPCLACGIKPPLVTVVKAAVAGVALSNRPSEAGPQSSGLAAPAGSGATVTASNVCPRCTFDNHPSLHTCEICGASLQPPISLAGTLPSGLEGRAQSPATAPEEVAPLNASESVKFSFRAGGEKTFHDRLKQALQQRKWLLQSTLQHSSTSNGFRDPAAAPPTNQPRAVGIAGLERKGDSLVRQNRDVIENAFEDLDALMASAKQIIALAEQFASQTRSSSSENGGRTTEASDLLSQLNLTTTKDMLSLKNSTNNLYIMELSRSLAEYLTDDTQGILKREGGIISLVDLWSVFNRARGGVELVSPSDFAAATEMFDTLKLPVRRRQFKSGIVVVQERSRTDERTTASILSWLEMMQSNPPDLPTSWDWQLYGQGATATQAADFFGWSVGVATEELEMAEERGAICRDTGLEGVKFWKNFLADEDFAARFERRVVDLDEIGSSAPAES